MNYCTEVTRTISAITRYLSVMVFSPDCLILAIVSAVVYLWKIASGIPNFKGEFDFYPSCGPVSPDKRFFALGADEIVNLYAITGALQQSINTHGRVRTLSFSEDGAYLETSQGSYKMTSCVLLETMMEKLLSLNWLIVEEPKFVVLSLWEECRFPLPF